MAEPNSSTGAVFGVGTLYHMPHRRSGYLSLIKVPSLRNQKPKVLVIVQII